METDNQMSFFYQKPQLGIAICVIPQQYFEVFEATAGLDSYVTYSYSLTSSIKYFSILAPLPSNFPINPLQRKSQHHANTQLLSNGAIMSF